MNLFCIFIFFCSSLVCLAKDGVMGIDLGSQYMKISMLVSGRDITIVENMRTQRKTNNAIAFVNKERLFETEPLNKRTRYPENSFVFINKFLGVLDSNEKVFEISKKYYDAYINELDPDRSTVQFTLKNFYIKDPEEIITLSVEEVMAMILAYAKMLATRMGGVEIKDCVVTVPAFWNLDQRQALVSAIQIAGLYPLSLVTENSAAALHYGVLRNDTEKNHTVLFYNIGANNLQTTIAEYNAVNASKIQKKPIEQVTILSDYGIEDVGGQAYDLVLANHFAEEIDLLPARAGKKSFKEERKGMIKLIKATEKLKEVLSANKQELPFFVEGLVDGNDFISKIDRTIFEQKSQFLFDQLTAPIDEVIKQSGKSIDQIDAIEVLGGSVRIPKIQQILQDYFKNKEVGSHMNGDESSTNGATFQAANSSHSFRVRPVWLNDGFDFSINLVIKNLDQSITEDSEDYYNKEVNLFSSRKRFGSKRSINFSYSKNILLELHTVSSSGEDKLLQSYSLTNITDLATNDYYKDLGKPKVHLQFILSSVNVIDFDQHELQLETIEEYSTYVEKEKTDSAESDNSTKPEKESVIKTRPKTISIPVSIESKYYGIPKLTADQIKKSQKLLKTFSENEKKIKELVEVKNNLESYVYQVKEFFTDDGFVSKFYTEEQKTKLVKLAEENEEYLYSDEIETATYTDVKDKLKKMERKIKSINVRIDEYKARPEAVNKTGKKIKEYEAKLAKLNRESPWINETQKEPLYQLINETVTWINDVVQQQSLKEEHEDPVFFCKELEEKWTKVHKLHVTVKNIKKTKEYREAEKEKKELYDMFQKGYREYKKKLKEDEGEEATPMTFEEYYEEMKDIMSNQKDEETGETTEEGTQENTQEDVKTENQEENTNDADDEDVKNEDL